MSDLQSLYQTIILEHSKARHGAVALTPLAEAATLGAASGLRVAESHQINTTCGDEVTLRVSLSARERADAAVTDLVWTGVGCSISQASASILTDTLRGLSTTEARALLDNFREMLRSRGRIEPDEEILGDAAAFGGVSRYPARVKCAMLSWVAFEVALIEAESH
ncbi:MAG: SUF system NifU family Fe-S cluster assembly protein [Cryobacterium sp.]|uniref:Fe-S cluster assembly sulfur transfer protein SufU n=1 Tax=unclassified Cryobacterium TaxID=2649013 RepID=UPI0018C94BB6|nr:MULTISPECIES: SUF system NifU family Fe-S cluster assembly protein [unclassified Cryobacterium]MCY7403328.1 SUF system NifU family Fe-S cluster assembly protein [Cryobacterium sp.]MEC5154417.1 nitrogen fixation NifU-like protein [Cryobacterium sp. CAN_C3]